MSLVYKFPFPAPAAGEDVVVTDDGGTEYATEALGSTVGRDGAITLEVQLDEGEYIGTVTGSFGTWSTRGLLDVPSSIEDAPGAAETAPFDRGTLYLKATVTDVAAIAEWADGTGAPFALVLDEERQGDTDIPDWADETAGVYSIVQGGGFLFSIAGKGTLTYDEIPTLAYVDMYHPTLSGLNYGWSSDGSENSEAFTPAEVNELAFGLKETSIVAVSPDALPVSLAGLIGDNYGDLTENPVISLDVLLSVTKIASGTRYTADDFS